MFCTTRRKALERVLPIPSIVIPSFLLPAYCVRQFSFSSSRSSQIGRTPLTIPPEVNFRILPPVVPKNASPFVVRNALSVAEVVGPRGKMSMSIPKFVDLEYDEETKKAYVAVKDKDDAKQRALWGTTRAYLQNHILGVSEGHTAILRLVGVGYRATVEKQAVTKEPEFEGQQFVVLKVGYSHPIELPLPKTMEATTPQPTRILLEGIDKAEVMQFAANIRKWRVPEPYKGKGIFVNGETIKLKAKKIK